MRTSAPGDKFSFFSSKLSAARNGFIPEGLKHLCYIKRLGVVAKWSQEREFMFLHDVLVAVPVVVAKAPY